MTHDDPLRKSHEDADATFLPWGDGPHGSEVVECYGPVELEYAAIRRGCGLIDLPQRGTVVVRGADRVGFLNRMLTQELKDLADLTFRRAFWLNRMGRIEADVRALSLGGAIVLDLERLVAARTAESLERFVVADDVVVADESGRWRRMALHGPAAGAVLGEVAGGGGSEGPGSVREGGACRLVIAGVEVVVERQDSAGEQGFEIRAPMDGAAAVYGEIVRAGGAGAHRVRRVGWHAYNVARIEAGWPLHLVDFGPDSIPNETGVLHDRVSFKKGCYLGQEVVARLAARGQPRRRLVGLRLERREVAAADPPMVAQPTTGAAVFGGDGEDARPEGAVTSSAVSPMLADTPIAFASVKPAHAGAGGALFVETGRERVRAEVQEGLRFWARRPGADAAAG